MRYGLLLLTLACSLCAAAQCDTFYYDYDHYHMHRDLHEVSQYLSMIGAQRKALLAEDTDSRYHGLKLRDLEVFDYDSAQPLVTSEILPTLRPALMRTHALVINEAHNIPTSRANLIPLIGDLRKMGYKDIFMETLAWHDTLREKYGYPDMHTGYYSREVMYGALLRRLMADSIRLHAYEEGIYAIDTARRDSTLTFISADYPDWIPVAADSFMLKAWSDALIGKREVTQALLIYQQLMHEQIDRYIIFCGYGHGQRSEQPWMGAILRHLTGDTMVVVDQTLLREHSSAAYDYDIYRRYAPADHAMLLSHADGRPLRIRRSAPDTGTIQLYDYYIITPRAELQYSRATWRTLGGMRRYYPISRILDRNILPASYMVLAYYMNEYSRLGDCAIPADILQVNDKKKDPALVLDPGRKYYIRATLNGRELMSKKYSTVE
ncbi:MAG: hypothetical protein JST83_16470 [Bacteroidetes bacterium]|nr:hypothetical protein [Bacteroidota bacterium]